jgi:HlyD family secretion protein
MAKTLIQKISEFAKRRWMMLVIAAIVIIVVLLIYNSVSAGSAAALANLQTASIERGSLTATIGATGSVRAIQSAILAWGANGTVEDVNVAVGDIVSADDVLASLELSSLPQTVILAQVDLEDAQDALDLDLAEKAKTLALAQNALEEAERDLYNLTHPGKQVDIDQAFANMVLAEDKLDQAREDYEPYANKPENNLTRANYLLRLTEAQKEYDSAVRIYNAFTGTANATDIAVAEGQVALAQGQLDLAQRDYDNAVAGLPNSAEARVAAAESALKLSVIEAPFSGIVTDAFPLPGDQVSAGAIGFQLDDLSQLLIDVQVSEVDINRVEVGQSAIITFDAAPDREYHGEVTGVALAGTIDSGVVNFRVTVEIADPDEFVHPAMTAAVNIVVTQLEDVLLVPNRAVRVIDGQRVVYILEDGQLIPVEVLIGASSETFSELLGGDLSETDTIVLNPPSYTIEAGQAPPQGIRQLFGSDN